MNIIIFGKIGTGKSTISSLIKQHYDVEIFNTDVIAKEVKLLEELKKVLLLLDQGLILNDQINDEYLKSVLFSDKNPTLKKQINNLLWNEISIKIKEKIRESDKNNFIIETVFYEQLKFDKSNTFVIKITCNKLLEKIRIKLRDKRSFEEINNIIKSQEQLNNYKYDAKINTTFLTKEKAIKKIRKIFSNLDI